MPDRGDDYVWICDPCEGLGLAIVLLEEAVHCGLKVGDRAEGAAFQTPFRQLGEEALDGVEPGAGSRREVEGEAFVAGEPLAHPGMLVGGVIVEDHMYDLAGGNLRLDGVEEADELLMPMALHVAADHRAIEDVEGREQRGRSISLVVVGHCSGAALLHRLSVAA